MNHKASMLNQEIKYKGYLTLKKCDFTVPSLRSIHQETQLNSREVVKTKDSVHVLIYSKPENSFLFCEEFRAGSFMNETDSTPFLYQCVAGTIEHDELPQETAKKEVKEETGIEASQLRFIGEVYKSPGILTELSYLFYCEVSKPITTGIFGVGEEEIKTHLISVDKAFHMVDTFKFSDAATLLILSWFRQNYIRF